LALFEVTVIPVRRITVKMFTSPTYGKLELEQIPEKLKKYYEDNKKYETQFHITIGTDSQNFSDTKIVSVITITCEGHGGIFFFEITRLPRISDVRKKLHTETNMSLDIADRLIELLETEQYEELFMNCMFSIHIDAGLSDNGKTKQLIPELVGWIKSCGYDCEIKPDSYTACSIANKISK